MSDFVRAIALAREAQGLPGGDNYQRSALREIAALLSAEPAQPETAAQLAADAVDHATYRAPLGFVETRDEVEVCQKVLSILKGALQ